jgi:hypothetical protein
VVTKERHLLTKMVGKRWFGCFGDETEGQVNTITGVSDGESCRLADSKSWKNNKSQIFPEETPARKVYGPSDESIANAEKTK